MLWLERSVLYIWFLLIACNSRSFQMLKKQKWFPGQGCQGSRGWHERDHIIVGRWKIWWQFQQPLFTHKLARSANKINYWSTVKRFSFCNSCNKGWWNWILKVTWHLILSERQGVHRHRLCRHQRLGDDHLLCRDHYIILHMNCMKVLKFKEFWEKRYLIF